MVFKETKNKQVNNNIYKQFKFRCSIKKGAILMAVARGKYSEGFNFINELCRALIMIGVPNLNITAAKV